MGGGCEVTEPNLFSHWGFDADSNHAHPLLHIHYDDGGGHAPDTCNRCLSIIVCMIIDI